MCADRLPALFIAGIACLAISQEAPAQTDNILILVADDLGVDSVSSFTKEGRVPSTPHIDALADRGVRFRTAWSYPVCSPTRACIMTGRYGFRTGVGVAFGHAWRPSPPLSLDELTLPELLDAGGSGYAHAAIGKWHLGEQTGGRTPNDAGWSHFAGLLAGHADYFSWPRCVDGVTSISHTYATTQQVDDALQWIGEQSGSWVCYLAFQAPHSPYHAPPSDLHSRDLSGVQLSGENRWLLYAAMVEAMDTEIGRLLRALGPTLEHTNVIFVGDNGTPQDMVQPPFQADHGKGSPYEGGMHVPLIVAGPAVVSPGRDEFALVSTVDLFATVAELAGVDVASAAPPRRTTDSVSFAPYLANPEQQPLRATMVTEAFYGAFAVTESGFVAIRNDRYKLIRLYSERSGSSSSSVPADELYDLREDPFEQQNLLARQLSSSEARAYDALAAALDDLGRPEGELRRLLTIAGLGVLCIGCVLLQRWRVRAAARSLSQRSAGTAIRRFFAIAVPGAALVLFFDWYLGLPRTAGLGVPTSGTARWVTLALAAFLAGSVLYGANTPVRAGSSAPVIAGFLAILVPSAAFAGLAYLVCTEPSLIAFSIPNSGASGWMLLILAGLSGALMLYLAGALLDRMHDNLYRRWQRTGLAKVESTLPREGESGADAVVHGTGGPEAVESERLEVESNFSRSVLFAVCIVFLAVALVGRLDPARSAILASLVLVGLLACWRFFNRRWKASGVTGQALRTAVDRA